MGFSAERDIHEYLPRMTAALEAGGGGGGGEVSQGDAGTDPWVTSDEAVQGLLGDVSDKLDTVNSNLADVAANTAEGANTEYTDGSSTEANPLGKVMMWKDTNSSNAIRAVSPLKPLPVDSELTTADLDTGGGTDTRAVIGLVLAESGGGLLVGSAHPLPISDAGGSLTVDATSLPLPTGAATAAKQAALGTAGTPSADVLSVQGVAGGTAQPISVAAAPNVTTTMQNATTTAINGTALDVSGMTAARFEVSITGGTATITWEASADGGTTYTSTNAASSGGNRSATATATGRYAIGCAGLTNIRARISAISAATVTVVGHAVAGGDIAGALLYNMDTAMQSAVAATGNGTVVDVSGFSGVGFQVTGTFVATITWEATIDTINWVAIPVTDVALGTQSTTTTAVGLFRRNCAGIKQIRARISAYTSGNVTVTAHAIVDSGAGQIPVGMYGKNSVVGDTALLLSPAGRVPIAGSTDSSLNGVTATTIANTSDSGGRILGAGQYGNNGNTFDAWRNNIEATLLSSAVRTATTNSTTQTNYNGRGVSIIINVTVAPAVETLTLAVQVQDSISGTWVTMQTGAAMTGTGTTRIVLYPGIGAVSNLAFSDVLARTWRVLVTHSASGSWTYSVSSAVIL